MYDFFAGAAWTLGLVTTCVSSSELESSDDEESFLTLLTAGAFLAGAGLASDSESLSESSKRKFTLKISNKICEGSHLNCSQL